jgi:hypothetical protein
MLMLGYFSDCMACLLGFASAVYLESESCMTRGRTLLSPIRDSLNMENQVPEFVNLRNKI